MSGDRLELLTPLRQALERIERKAAPLLADPALLDGEEGQDLLDVICMQFLAAGEALKRLEKSAAMAPPPATRPRRPVHDRDVSVELAPLTPYATVHLKQELEALLQGAAQPDAAAGAQEPRPGAGPPPRGQQRLVHDDGGAHGRLAGRAHDRGRSVEPGWFIHLKRFRPHRSPLKGPGRRPQPQSTETVPRRRACSCDATAWALRSGM